MDEKTKLPNTATVRAWEATGAIFARSFREDNDQNCSKGGADARSDNRSAFERRFAATKTLFLPEYWNILPSEVFKMSDELDKDAKAPEVDAGQVQKELSTQELDEAAGGLVSNIMKTKHDTAKKHHI
jgi:hypothetical protein